MDLISIFGKVWRHKAVTIPVVILMALGAFYIIAVKAPVYQTTLSILLVNPPGPPSPQQIAKDPSLGRINTGNTFVSFGNLDVVADAVVGVVSAESNQLVNAGADPRYQLTVSGDVGSPPIITITGVGSTAQEAVLSANLVTKAAENSLYQVQAGQNINPIYMVKAVKLYPPQSAQKSSSSKVRTLVAVLGIGIILLFIVISFIEALERRRAPRPAKRRHSPEPAGSRHSPEPAGWRHSPEPAEQHRVPEPAELHRVPEPAELRRSDYSTEYREPLLADESATMILPRVFSPPGHEDQGEDRATEPNGSAPADRRDAAD